VWEEQAFQIQLLQAKVEDEVFKKNRLVHS